jgi:polyhydroxyalkanoate synthesis regulator phasin
MKKLLTTIGIVVALGAGVFAVSTVLPASAQNPSTSSSSDSSSSSGSAACAAPGRGQVVKNALDGLVQKGTITQDQENAVIQSLQDAAKGAKHGNGNGRAALRPRARIAGGMVKVAADKIGVQPQDLVTARRNGQSVADVANSKGVNPSDVVTAIVNAGDQKIDQAVSNGTINQDKADKAKAKLPQLADKFVNTAGKTGGCAPSTGSLPGSGSGSGSTDSSTSSDSTSS